MTAAAAAIEGALKFDDRDGVSGIVGREGGRTPVPLIPKNYNSADVDAADAESGSSCKIGDLSPPPPPPPLRSLARSLALFDGQGPSDGRRARSLAPSLARAHALLVAAVFVQVSGCQLPVGTRGVRTTVGRSVAVVSEGRRKAAGEETEEKPDLPSPSPPEPLFLISECAKKAERSERG